MNAVACCDDPKPRILEKNQRLFCANCRRYLDKKVEAPPTAEPDKKSERETP